MKKIIIAILIAVLLSTMVYYQRPIKALAYSWGHAIIGGLSSGTGVPLKVDSEGQLYVNMSGMTLIYTGVRRGGVSQIVSTVSRLVVANLAFGLVQFEHGSGGVHRLADGVDGQEVTFELLADPSYTIGDNPMTRTGWDTITFNDAHDRITLVWLDDTYGWIIIGNDGCVITY